MLRSDHSAFLTGSPFLRLAKLSLVLAGAALALGCTPKIGDECTVSTNCSTSGDRLCDITQPGGYCTIFNCEPGSCPEDSVCVNFGTSLSLVPGCDPSQGNSPYERSFCMATCSSQSDCRGGYVCDHPSELGAVLAENSGNDRVCAVKPNPAPDPSSHSNQVCTGAGGGSSGGMSSIGGAAGVAAGGSSGEGGAAGDAGAGG